MAQPAYHFTIKPTAHGATVTETRPRGEQRTQRFRDGLMSGIASAQEWVRDEVKRLNEFWRTEGLPPCQIFVDGVLQGTEPKLVELPIMTTNRPYGVIKHWRDNGWLELSPPYQRGDVWGPTRRVNFIRSLLMGIPVPSIVINDRLAANWPNTEHGYAVIDGKQRCTTILMFLDSQLSVPAGWFGLPQPEIVFSELPIATQRRFENKAIGMCEARLRSIVEEQQVFELINFGGVPPGETDIPDDSVSAGQTTS